MVKLTIFRATGARHFSSVKGLTAVKRKNMRNALVTGPGRGNFPREILIETFAETGVRQNIVEQSSEIR